MILAEKGELVTTFSKNRRQRRIIRAEADMIQVSGTDGSFVPRGVLTGENRCSRGHAKRGGTVGTIHDYTVTRKRVERRRPYERMPVVSGAITSELVCRYKNDVFQLVSLLFRLVRSQAKKGQCDAALRTNSAGNVNGYFSNNGRQSVKQPLVSPGYPASLRVGQVTSHAQTDTVRRLPVAPPPPENQRASIAGKNLFGGELTEIFRHNGVP